MMNILRIWKTSREVYVKPWFKTEDMILLPVQFYCIFFSEVHAQQLKSKMLIFLSKLETWGFLQFKKWLYLA